MAIETRSRRLAPGLGSVVLLTALAAVGQFASNIYTPSLPFVARALGVEAGVAQQTLAIYMFAYACAQLVYGPLTDRYGRRPVLFVGLSLFLAGTLGCALSTDIATLLAARTVQAMGAAGAMVVSRAATRDSFDGVELARTIAAITIAFALVPGVTPLIGGIAQEHLDWRATFWLTLAVGATVLAFAAVKLPETARKRLERIETRAIVRSYGVVLSNRAAMAYALTAGCVFSCMAAFFAGSPALLIDELGVSPSEYGLYPPVAVTGFIIGGMVSRRAAGKIEPRRLAAYGLALMAMAVGLMLAFPLFGLVHKFLFVGTMVVNVAGLGIFMPTAVTQVLSRFPERAGVASALQGFIQMTGGAIGAVAVSFLQLGLPILAMPMVMVAGVACAIAVLWLGVPRDETARHIAPPTG